MKYVMRILNIVIASVLSIIVFDKVYQEYYKYLPVFGKLAKINEHENIKYVLQENSMGLRDMYNHAFERSVLYAGLTFILVLIVLEYIRAGNFIYYYFRGMKDNDLKYIKD